MKAACASVNICRLNPDRQAMRHRIRTEWLPSRRGYGKGRDDAMNGDWAPFAVAFLVAGALGGLVVILVGLFRLRSAGGRLGGRHVIQ